MEPLNRPGIEVAAFRELTEGEVKALKKIEKALEDLPLAADDRGEVMAAVRQYVRATLQFEAKAEEQQRRVTGSAAPGVPPVDLPNREWTYQGNGLPPINLPKDLPANSRLIFKK